MINAVIVDDERPALTLLERMLEERGVRVVGSFTKPSELKSRMAALEPDAVFLDIDMPGTSGLELASELKQKREEVQIVFVTAYRHYAVEAFQVNAMDYLLKPLEAEWLDRAIARLNRNKGSKPQGTDASSITCLGRFEVGCADRREPLRFPTVKTEELLAFFLVNRETAVSKWAICESLWPGFEPEKVEQNLHTTVYRMKKTLTDNGVPIHLSSHRGGYRFQYEGECDYIRFGSALDGREEEAAGTERTLRQYGGPLFGDKDYIWCAAERERMRALFVHKSRQLAETYMEEGAFGKAIHVLQHAIAKAPLEEAVYECLLLAYYKQGDRGSFLQYYDQWERQLNEELGLKPGEQIRQLCAQIEERG